MNLLPDEDDKPVAAQVYAVLGEALRQSVADAEPSPGFAAGLRAALDAVALDARDGAPALAAAAAGEGAGAGMAAPNGAGAVAGQAATGAPGQGSEATEVAS